VTVLNLDPGLLGALPITAPGREAGGGPAAPPGASGGPGTDGRLGVGVRTVIGGKLAGNGLGRPAACWDLDLQLPRPGQGGAPDILLGDLVAITDIDARYNMGYRRDWVSVGIVGHGSSPLPGHGPGMTAILTAPATALDVRPDQLRHVGLTERALKLQ
jgi:hypothetical protein